MRRWISLVVPAGVFLLPASAQPGGAQAEVAEYLFEPENYRAHDT